ncbi:MAG: hypothetical protein ACRENO_03750 [Thermodesulfobacteriota bacterium]
MKNFALIAVLFTSMFTFFTLHAEEIDNYDDMIKNPSRYIEVIDWHFYVAAKVAIIYGVTLENKSSVTYKDLKIRVNYFSPKATSFGTKIAEQKATLNITLPPKSKMKYLKGGYPIGAGSRGFIVKNLDILSADVVKN